MKRCSSFLFGCAILIVVHETSGPSFSEEGGSRDAPAIEEQTFAAAIAKTPAPPAASARPAAAPAAVGASGLFGGRLALGIADGLIQIARGDDWILLAHPRVMTSDDDEDLYGLGFVRRRRPSAGLQQTSFLRLDLRHIRGDHWFSTTSGGYEHRSQSWTWRLRGYLSPHGSEVVERRIEEESIRRPDGAIATLRRTRERLIIPLSGAEAEVGVRLPLPHRLGTFRYFSGAHYRDGPDFDTQWGWIARLEFRPLSRFILDVSAYIDRDFSRADYFLGLSALFPFGGGGQGGGGDADWLEPPPFNPQSIQPRKNPPQRELEEIIGVRRPRPPRAAPPPQRAPPPSVPLQKP